MKIFTNKEVLQFDNNTDTKNDVATIGLRQYEK